MRAGRLRTERAHIQQVAVLYAQKGRTSADIMKARDGGAYAPSGGSRDGRQAPHRPPLAARARALL